MVEEFGSENVIGGDVASVGVVMGSSSDWEALKPCCATLEKLGIPYERYVISAHRTPDRCARYAQGAEERGLKAIIAAAGMSAHLAGVIAASTLLPVIGIPMKTSMMGGLDSLLSIVQMPRGIPVATVAVGSAGAQNAALLAARFLALSDGDLRSRLDGVRDEMVEAASGQTPWSS